MFHTNLAKWCAVSIVFITVLFLYFLSGSYSGFMLFSKPTVTSPKTFARHKEATAVTILRNVVSEKNGKIKVEEKTAVDHVTFTEKELRSAAASNCHYFQSLDDLDGVELSDGTLMALGTYKKKKRDEFLRNFPHPPPKNTPRQKIKPQLEQTGSKPAGILHDPDEEMDVDLIYEDVRRERERCLSLGDDDLFKIPEVKKELKQKKYKVPNLLHFIWFGCNRLRVDHYMALMGALRYQKPRLILFHCDCEPTGEYWDAFKTIAAKSLRIVRRTPPETIWGLKIGVVEHQADVVRLQLLLEVGGMYMDTDSVIVKSLNKFRNEEATLGQETSSAVANGIILASKDSWYIQRWYWEYKYFRDDVWGHNSVIVAWALALHFPDKLHLERNTFCRPNWGELNLLYYELVDWSPNYIVHLYSRFLPNYEGKHDRPLKQLAVLNTTYGEIARHVIWGDAAIRDVTNWIDTCKTTQLLIDARP